MLRRFMITAVLVAVVPTAHFAAAQPTAGDPNLVSWWRADRGVVIDPADGGIARWEDQSGNGNHATRHVGGDGTHKMTQATRNFGGINNQAVVRFTKVGFFDVPNGSGQFNLKPLTVFAVVENTGVGRRHYFANYTSPINWGFGYTYGLEGNILRDFTSNGHGPEQTNPNPLPPNPPTIPDPNNAINDSAYSVGGFGTDLGIKHLKHTLDVGATTGVKHTFLNGVDLGAHSIGPSQTVPPVDYDSGPPANVVNGCPACGGKNALGVSIGSLGRFAGAGGHFYFHGDIAEIIVFRNLDSQRDAQISSYLSARYGTVVPEPACAALLLIAGCSWRTRRRAG